MILIKDNHIESVGGIARVMDLLTAAAENLRVKKEIEVKNIDELKTVLKERNIKIDRIMLDNFSLRDLNKLKKIDFGNIEIEVSGGINERNIGKYGKMKNIDFISIGTLTHSAKALDISLNFIT